MGDERVESLSPQQRRCLLLVAEGLTTKEIAFELGVSNRTVDEHIEKAVAKLRAPSRQRAAAILRRLTGPPDNIDPHPYPIRGEIIPVDETDQIEPIPSTTLLLNDGERTPFEGFPTVDVPTAAASKETQGDAAANHFKIILNVLAITVLLLLILLAMPALIDGAERLAGYVLETVRPE